jgi:hypothetical protein
MDFGQAIVALKSGHRAARDGLPPYSTQGTERKVNDRTAKWIGEDAPLNCRPYLALFNSAGGWQPGWNASQADMLADDDWTVVEG